MTSAAAAGAELFENSQGLLKLLGIVLEDASPDRVVLAMEVGPNHLQPHGVTHGGIHATLVESAASIGGHLWIKAQRGAGTVVGVANNTDFLRPFTGGRLTATATPIYRGRSAQLWAVEITSVNGKLIARGQVRLHNMTEPA